MALPRLLEMAQRVAMERHRAHVEDRLDESPPSIGVVIRPWHGPMKSSWTLEGRFEVALEEAGPEIVVVRYESDGSDNPLEGEERIPAPKLTARWLETRFLDFIAQLLRVA